LLDIDEMRVAQGALRHGVLYELLERDDSVADMRATTVARLASRFAVDSAQARRVGETAAALFVQLMPSAQGASSTHSAGRALRKLRWAAALHEIGNHIAHSDSHKHGAYILDNVEAPGFAINELHALSQLVLGHRGKLRKIELALDSEVFTAQLMALRLAVVLCHARRDPDIGTLRLSRAGEQAFALRAGADWAEQFPQSAHLLHEEVLAWQKANIQLALQIA
ncbi:MAG: exopolyphosphatase, partial [Comamonadaceae bacterium]